MCGRFYVSEAELDDFAALIDGIEKDLLKPRPNRTVTTDIVPGDFAPVLVPMPDAKNLDGIAGLPAITIPAGIRVFSWGFPGVQGKSRIINARAETVADKPMFRLPFSSHRCLVPARGFYEWSDANGSEASEKAAGVDEPLQMSLEGLFAEPTPAFRGGLESMMTEQVPSVQTTNSFGRQINAARHKQPRIRHRFLRTDGRMLLMAGIYWNFKLSAIESVTAFTILTVAANADVSPVHNRMPLILEDRELAIWLGPSSAENLLPLLVPSRGGILYYDSMLTG